MKMAVFHMFHVVCFFILVLCLIYTNAWDNDDMEIYDAVEEVNHNFYEYLGVEYGATSADIRRAYRRLSIKLHPDKNKELDAEEKFRKMVTVYEILKDETKRRKYNDVLENGLPDWRQPVYYFRKARKVTLTELFVLLFVIGAVGQYFVLWAMFFEKQLSLEDFFSSKRRRSNRKKKDGLDPDEQLQEELDALPRPKFVDLFPWRLGCLLCRIVISSPTYMRTLREYIRERKEMKKVEEEESSEEEEIEYVRKPKRRQKINLPEYMEDEYTTPVTYHQLPQQEDSIELLHLKHGNWTDDELGLLAKGVAKYPGGTSGRWRKIAEFVGRTVEEVIEKSHELRPTGSKSVNPAAQGTTGFDAKPQTFKKGKVIRDDIISTNDAAYAHVPDDDLIPVTTTTQTSCEGKTRNTSGESKTSKIPVAKLKAKDAKKKNIPATNTNMSVKIGTTKAPVSNETNNEVTQLPGDSWTQNQQVILEWALKQYPRTCADRWDQIATHIPGKTKEECMLRFKHLAEMLKQRRQQNSVDS